LQCTNRTGISSAGICKRSSAWPDRRSGNLKTEIRRKTGNKIVLVLQGGGALGAYQAGVFEALAEAGHAPTGSPASRSARSTRRSSPATRPNGARRLREFWDQAYLARPFLFAFAVGWGGACSTGRRRRRSRHRHPRLLHPALTPPWLALPIARSDQPLRYRPAAARPC
jgi:NTE family protein